MYDLDKYLYRSNHNYRPVMRKRYGEYGDVEVQILEALHEHPLRTDDPTQASVFVIPVSLTDFFVRTGDFKSLYADIANETIFQKYHGHQHLIIAQTPLLFSRPYIHPTKVISRGYKILWNVTVAKFSDQDGCRLAVDRGFITGSNADFKSVMIGAGHAMSRSTFSISHIPDKKLPLIPATMTRFINATYQVFQQSRPSKFVSNSTQYRRALINNTNTDSSLLHTLYHNSSIGFGLDSDQWTRSFSSSRFCMVIRGDDPTSRTFLRAVKFGCIPVIVSNLVPVFAPVFKSSIDIRDFTIIIDETKFLENPVEVIVTRLNRMDWEEVKAKMKWLELAQRLVVPDHPESLFVPALMYEMQMARETSLSKNQTELVF